MMGKTNTKHGFTIVELLIVIVVIAILAAITIVAYNGIQTRARTAEKVSDVSAVMKQLELFYADNGYYPRIDRLSPANIDATRATMFNNVSKDIFIAPGSTQPKSSYIGYVGGILPEQYTYKSFTSSGAQCDNASNTPDESVCVRYTIWYLVDSSSTAVARNGANGW
jgi:prepilin-type N-terminal cleavage/methylation domain-containing protein